jgi:Serine/threonine protein kinase
MDSYQQGQYEFLQRVAYAPSYEIWRALDLQSQQMVLVTVLHLRTGPDGQVPLFLAETRSLSTLDHPGLAKVLTVQFAHPSNSSTAALTDGWIVTENVAGLSLADYLVETSYQGHFPSLSELYQIMAPLCSALDHAHQHGVIHGCLRPEYIIFPAQDNQRWYGTAVIVGLGLHIVLARDQFSLDDAHYATPEQIRAQVENIRSDIYALGLILYELCTGSRPFLGTTVDEVMQQQLAEMPLSPIHSNPHLLPGLVPIIFRCLAKDPSARFPSGAALLTALHNLRQHDRQRLSTSSPENSLADLHTNAAADVLRSSPLLTPTDGAPTILSPRNDTPGIPQSAEAKTVIPQSAEAKTVEPSDQPVATYYPTVAPTVVPTTMSHPSLQPRPVTSSYPDASIPKMASQLAASLGKPASALTPQLVTPMPTSGAIGFVPLKPRSVHTRRKRFLSIGLSVLVCLLLIGAGLLAFFSSVHKGASAVQTYGGAFFTSSGLLNHDNTLGLLDGVQISLQNIAAPPAGKQYYAWLLPTTDTTSEVVPPLALGRLTVVNGKAHVAFQDRDQSNLLAHYSRFLVTEEDAGSVPQNPSLNASAQRFFAAFSNVPNPDDKVNKYSLLNHMQHLLVQDPTLKAAGIRGGLSINLYRNMTKVMAWSGSARDAQISGDEGLVLRQTARVLAYLEGKTFATRENLPSGLHPDQMVDQTAEKVPLITIGNGQGSESYFQHIGFHLREITHSVNVTTAQKNLSATINDELNNANAQLLLAYKNAHKVAYMTEDQLRDPRNNALALLSDMFTYINNAFSGQVLAGTTQISGGVAQIFYDTQRLPTFEVLPCGSNNACV